MVQGEIRVVLREGIHLRVATEIARFANRFGSRIRIVHPEGAADAKSILSLLGVGGAQGTTLRITCEGPDETEAFASLSRLLS